MKENKGNYSFPYFSLGSSVGLIGAGLFEVKCYGSWLKRYDQVKVGHGDKGLHVIHLWAQRRLNFTVSSYIWELVVRLYHTIIPLSST